MILIAIKFKMQARIAFLIFVLFTRVTQYVCVEQDKNLVAYCVRDNETEIGCRVGPLSFGEWHWIVDYHSAPLLIAATLIVRKFIHNSVIKCTHARKLQWKLAPAEEPDRARIATALNLHKTPLDRSPLFGACSWKMYMWVNLYIYATCKHTTQGVCMCERGRSRWECKHVQSCMRTLAAIANCIAGVWQLKCS